jgi:hypothetical protein
MQITYCSKEARRVVLPWHNYLIKEWFHNSSNSTSSPWEAEKLVSFSSNDTHILQMKSTFSKNIDKLKVERNRSPKKATKWGNFLISLSYCNPWQARQCPTPNSCLITKQLTEINRCSNITVLQLYHTYANHNIPSRNPWKIIGQSQALSFKPSG